MSRQVPRSYKVTLSIVAAEDLERGIFLKPKAFAIAELDGREILRTQSIISVNPYWDTYSRLDITAESLITIEVRNERKISKKHPDRGVLGIIRLTTEDLISLDRTGKGEIFSKALLPLHESQHSRGKLKIHIRVAHVDTLPTPQPLRLSKRPQLAVSTAMTSQDRGNSWRWRDVTSSSFESIGTHLTPSSSLPPSSTAWTFDQVFGFSTSPTRDPSGSSSKSPQTYPAPPDHDNYGIPLIRAPGSFSEDSGSSPDAPGLSTQQVSAERRPQQSERYATLPGLSSQDPGVSASQSTLAKGTILPIQLFNQQLDTTSSVEVLSAEICAQGATANILKGRLNDASRMTVALKVFRAILSADDTKLLEREISACREVRHENILEFIGTSSWGFHTILISQFMANGNLEVYLRQHPQADRTTLILQVATALQYLHDEVGRVHGDIKPKNVLVDDRGRAVLADFGLSTTVVKVDEGVTGTGIRNINTLRYAAPELVTGNIEHSRGDHPRSKTRETDVYAFGMLIYQVYADQVPWSQYEQHAIILQLYQGNYPSRPARIPDHHWNLCIECWKIEPRARPVIREVISRLSDAL